MNVCVILIIGRIEPDPLYELHIIPLHAVDILLPNPKVVALSAEEFIEYLGCCATVLALPVELAVFDWAPVAA